MKIGILTFYRCINYGSYWQARCLLEALLARGHKAVLLDARSRSIDIAEWRCALRPVRPAPVPRSDYPLYRDKTRKFFDAFAELPCSAPFDLAQPDQMEHYDLVIVGSDEVWNPWHPWYGGCRLFFGEGLRAGRLVSYAACFGNYPAAAGLPQTWAEALRRFELISVRGRNSRDLVRSGLGREPELALDPCLLLPPPEPEAAAAAASPDTPYAVVYGHNFSGWFIEQVGHWARRRQCRLVSIGYRNDWADEQWLTAGPQEFAACVRGAEAVVTNFFHGCVFGLRYHKPLVCENAGYRSIKIADLMHTLGAQQRLVSQRTPVRVYETQLHKPPGLGTRRRIAALRSRSQAYLDLALRRIAPAHSSQHAGT